MKAVIVVDMDNAAFVDNEESGDNGTAEFARILRELAGRIDGYPRFTPGFDQTLRDINGNAVGYCAVLSDGQEWTIYS